MKINKVALLGLMFAMPFTSEVSSNSSNNSLSQNQIDLASKAAGMAFYAPIAGLMLGCERRTLDQMTQTVKKQLNSDEIESFNGIFLNEKMDTKPYTTATGPLSLVALAGVVSLSPVGIGIAFFASLGNAGCLYLAAKSQQYNNSRYQKALAAINLEKGLKKETQVTGDSDLSDLQKLFCLSVSH